MPILVARNVVEHAYKKHNARQDDTSISPFTSMSRHDNAHGSWRKHQSFPRPNASARKSRLCLRNLKNQIGLRRLRLRRMKFVREQFFLAAAAQNIKRLVRFLTQPTTPALAATT